MPKVLWPKKAGPRKVWPLTPADVRVRRREAAAKAAADGQSAADNATITAAISTTPFIAGYSG